MLNVFLDKIRGYDQAFFEDVWINVIPFVEFFAQFNIFLYEIDTVNEARFWKLAQRKFGTYSNPDQLLPYNSHIC